MDFEIFSNGELSKIWHHLKKWNWCYQKMSITKNVLLNSFFSRGKNQKDSDDFWKSNFGTFDTSPLLQFSKFNNLLWVHCWKKKRDFQIIRSKVGGFLTLRITNISLVARKICYTSICWPIAKKLSNFVSLPWKLHNQYCHNIYIQIEKCRNANSNLCYYFKNIKKIFKRSGSHYIHTNFALLNSK